CFCRWHDLDIQSGQIMIFQIGLDLVNQDCVMCTARVEPEYSRHARHTCTTDRQLYPVTDRAILGLAHTENVTLFHFLFEQHLAGLISNAHCSCLLDLEGLVVTAVLLGGLSHQTHVWNGTHCDRIQ